MRKTLIAAALAVTFAVPALADDAPSPLTGNFTLATDYVFRGITQTQHSPAVQGGIDYAHDSGLYVGTWFSNVSWVTRSDWNYKQNNSLEWDVYGGYKFSAGDVGFDVGVISYTYPGKSLATYNGSQVRTPDTAEAYVGATYGPVTLKYNQVVSNSFIGWGGTDDVTKKNTGSQYIDLTATVPVTEKVAVIAHVGRQNVKNFYQASYTDYKLGVTYDAGFGVLGLTYTTTDSKQTCSNTRDISSALAANAYCWNNKNVAKDALFASFTKTF